MRHLVLPNIEPNERNHRLYILALETFNLQTFEFKFFLVLGKLGFLLYYLVLPSPIKILGFILITWKNLGTGFNLKRNIFLLLALYFSFRRKETCPSSEGTSFNYNRKHSHPRKVLGKKIF